LIGGLGKGIDFAVFRDIGSEGWLGFGDLRQDRAARPGHQGKDLDRPRFLRLLVVGALAGPSLPWRLAAWAKVHKFTE
jgi:hypothetical protein